MENVQASPRSRLAERSIPNTMLQLQPIQKSFRSVPSRAEYERQWRKTNIERVRENNRKWRNANPERLKEIQRRWREKNRHKILTYQREYNSKNRERRIENGRDANYKRKYRISLKEYEVFLKTQKGRCAICGGLPGKKKLSVDHHHLTGTVRGLLCRSCNLMIGFACDSVDVLAKGIEYLRS